MIVQLAFDGGCRNNPNGPGSSGEVLQDIDGRTLRHVGRAIPAPASNNVAEWTGLLIGLEAALELGASSVASQGDSQLVVRQFSGEFAVREERLRALSMQAHRLRARFADGVTLTWVPRERNRAADAICTAVLDGTYRPDADLDDLTSDAPEIEVAFVVAARLDGRVAAAAVARGEEPKALRKALAAEVERKLLLTGKVGHYTVTPARIKG
jgi:probable phosphoglycerate mutase